MTATGQPFPYAGPETLREPVRRALARVVDPEVAMSIVDVGLVCGVTIAGDRADVQLTMTSAACPVADLIVDEAEVELDAVLPPELAIAITLVWEPPWTPERMSPQGRRLMGW